MAETRARRRLWRVLLAFLFVLAVLSVLFHVAWHDAPRKIAAFKATVAEELERENQRVLGLRRPVFRGDPIDEEAIPRYREAREGGWKADSEMDSYTWKTAAAKEGLEPVTPGKDAPPRVIAFVASHIATLERVHEAVRRTRLSRERMGPESLGRATWGLSKLLSLECQVRFHAHDQRGALATGFTMARFGCDLVESGEDDATRGAFVVYDGLRCMTHVVTSGDLGSGELERLGRELDELDAIAPSCGAALGRERLCALDGVAVSFEGDDLSRDCVEGYNPFHDFWSGGAEQTLFRKLAPLDLRESTALVGIDSLYRKAIAALGEPDPHAALQRLADEAYTSPSCVVYISAPQPLWTFEWLRGATAQLALVKTAVRLEQYYAKSGAYPHEGSDLILGDPYEPGSKLQYSCKEGGYSLSARMDWRPYHPETFERKPRSK